MRKLSTPTVELVNIGNRIEEKGISLTGFQDDFSEPHGDFLENQPKHDHFRCSIG